MLGALAEPSTSVACCRELAYRRFDSRRARARPHWPPPAPTYQRIPCVRVSDGRELRIREMSIPHLQWSTARQRLCFGEGYACGLFRRENVEATTQRDTQHVSAPDHARGLRVSPVD